MQKAIWKGILVPVSFYYAGRCHVCNEAECRWQSGRNGSLILTMINEQRWKMNYAPLLEGRNILCENVNFACQPAGKPGESGGDAGEGGGGGVRREGGCIPPPYILCKVNTSVLLPITFRNSPARHLLLYNRTSLLSVLPLSPQKKCRFSEDKYLGVVYFSLIIIIFFG